MHTLERAAILHNHKALKSLFNPALPFNAPLLYHTQSCSQLQRLNSSTYGDVVHLVQVREIQLNSPLFFLCLFSSVMTMVSLFCCERWWHHFWVSWSLSDWSTYSWFLQMVYIEQCVDAESRWKLKRKSERREGNKSKKDVDTQPLHKALSPSGHW